ncbi:hypothetical protein VTP01DRAFT_868 [Rhizomucor pusillus]|uniref:uncharacterized protein n=1 Tax=Rhizomucor pusillus TaxID=4840 RepID=UPI00374357AD
MTHHLWLDPLGLHFKAAPPTPAAPAASKSSAPASNEPKPAAPKHGNGGTVLLSDNIPGYCWHIPQNNTAQPGFNFNFYCASLLPVENKPNDAKPKPKQ